MDIKGKRLLILGGTTLMIHVVKEAKAMGVYTVVTDMSPTSPAKKYADKAYDISTNDYPALIEMAKKEKIDGLFAGYDDFNTSVAVELSSLLNLRFYANSEQIGITKDKKKFKDLCRQFGVPVVKEYTVENVKYPCVVKPVDSYSAKGITICYNKTELDAAIEYAIGFSASKQYIIEKYIDCRFAECVNIDYVLADGKIELSAVGDKKVIRQENKAPITAAVYYPSKYMNEYIEHVDSKVKEMFSSLGMKDGTVFIESFFDEDGFAIYEMGYRVGGGQSSIILNALCDVDYIKMLISYTMTGEMCPNHELERVNPRIGQYACGLVLLAKPGTISKIVGTEAVESMPEVVNVTQYLHEGDTVDSKFLGTLGQTFARIHIIAETIEKVQDAVENVQHVLRAFDADGNDMIVENHPVY